MSAAPVPTEPSPFLSVEEAARLACMSCSNIRRRCVTDGLGFRPGGRGEWLIRRVDFERWLNGEVLR
ncbi:helix-turn-helix domain-containing protein [Lichenibacterium ramalinae]|uniref:Helix-turn-helix domain-containing protein n=1 Tax=Lichenibacterium ramalinae TaxID=2316527 RepID=A0A4Q2R6G0_9HYPH|nr:helix-turn-helix domain-containing protein [Lichenibacterium ramalinae]RYB01511.1 helix-turn-helix domain-containing protein [Lichenibacterium ramalinae]